MYNLDSVEDAYELRDPGDDRRTHPVGLEDIPRGSDPPPYPHAQNDELVELTKQLQELSGLTPASAIAKEANSIVNAITAPTAPAMEDCERNDERSWEPIRASMYPRLRGEIPSIVPLNEHSGSSGSTWTAFGDPDDRDSDGSDEEEESPSGANKIDSGHEIVESDEDIEENPIGDDEDRMEGGPVHALRGEATSSHPKNAE
uniref:Uncharacterized protein n=1 Tax=Knipowitschia caucasica TaxID=637954 RepID=A0AAV2IXA1_KNICA